MRGRPTADPSARVGASSSAPRPSKPGTAARGRDALPTAFDSSFNSLSSACAPTTARRRQAAQPPPPCAMQQPVSPPRATKRQRPPPAARDGRRTGPAHAVPLGPTVAASSPTSVSAPIATRATDNARVAPRSAVSPLAPKAKARARAPLASPPAARLGPAPRRTHRPPTHLARSRAPTLGLPPAGIISFSRGKRCSPALKTPTPTRQYPHMPLRKNQRAARQSPACNVASTRHPHRHPHAM